jgi:hypothetical protein
MRNNQPDKRAERGATRGDSAARGRRLQNKERVAFKVAQVLSSCGQALVILSLVHQNFVLSQHSKPHSKSWLSQITNHKVATAHKHK